MQICLLNSQFALCVYSKFNKMDAVNQTIIVAVVWNMLTLREEVGMSFLLISEH